MRTQWPVLLSGVIWLILFFISLRASIADLLPAWLLPVLWFGLPPIYLVIYAFSSSSNRYRNYPRRVWDMRSWAASTLFLWLFQSGLFAAHMIRFGFFEPLRLGTAVAAAVASTIAILMWVDAFWTDVIGVYRLKPLSTVREYM